MSIESQAATLLAQIRRTYDEGPQAAPQRISQMIASRLGELPREEGRAIVRQMLESLQDTGTQTAMAMDPQVTARVFSLILGRPVSLDDLSSAQLIERLSQSLKTIFDALNQLISVINTTLRTGDGTGEQTIRQYIGYHLEGEDQTKSLEAYLGQINQAFLTTHEAFKKAAKSKVQQILTAIDPKAIAAERSGGGLKIGPLRKAEDFDILREKIDRIQRWFDSGKFMEDFLREFEKNCEALSRR